MAKHVTTQIRLQVTGGQATPAPPVGPALGQHGVNIGAFVTQFNDRTKEMRGITVPVVITVYSDRSFEFIIKSPPAAVLLKQAAGIPLEKKKGGELIPAEEKGSRRLLIMLHGLGDSMEGYRWVPEALDLPWLNYLLVNAPDSYYGGYSWYDFAGDMVGVQSEHLTSVFLLAGFLEKGVGCTEAQEIPGRGPGVDQPL